MYDRAQYACDRTTVLSRDGKTEIPVSLVFRKNVMEEHAATGKTLPTHLCGYGSYSSSIEDDFDSTRLPLLDRGMVYAIAHVRGGGEMGRSDHGEHANELALSNCSYYCGCLKVVTGEKKEGIKMIREAVSIDTRLYGEMYHVTHNRRDLLQRLLNGEDVEDELRYR
uniref:Prolyl endopeptidase n=1 Tax=Minutocellus polymorphus TaxID=265543 RepID=A0A6U0KBW6_9STRA|mmetsp:Transcript_3485/g.6004  ORF Transcript_3485/g.6004 Transcript_3485/m.6004 type:complete len:167 (+) Transcript_3485:403-903(+)